MAARKEVSISILSFLLLMVLSISLGAWFRAPELSRRPMHTDEAILAVKTAEVWEKGHFDYDPKDIHGPALHQVAWVWGHLSGWEESSTWKEEDVRSVSVACGLALIVVTLLLMDALGRTGTAFGLLILAVSPVFVFYSRYYIMEMLLVLLVALMLGCFWRYAQGGTRLWLLLGGAALGFQHATKETFVINAAAAVCGWAVARALVGGFQPQRSGSSLSLGSGRSKKSGVGRPWLWVLVSAVLVSVASYSWGFKDWGAVKDSVLTYGNYLGRSTGSGHEKPWYYYFAMLFWHKDTILWTELFVGGCAVVGMLYSLVGEFKNSGRQAFLIFLSVYTIALFVIYSLISYKTPWCVLSAHFGLILLAGVGAAVVWESLSGRLVRWGFNLLFAAGLWHLCHQTSISTGMNRRMPYEADSRSPYVYSHPATSLLKLLADVQGLRAERGKELSIQVINRDAGWPLPWYWRNSPTVGYHVQMPDRLDSDLLVVESDLVDTVKHVPGGSAYEATGAQYGLRPGVLLALLVKKTAAPPPQQPAAPAESPAMREPGAPPAEGGAAPAVEDKPPTPPQGTLTLPPPTFSPTLPPLPGIKPPQS